MNGHDSPKVHVFGAPSVHLLFGGAHFGGGVGQPFDTARWHLHLVLIEPFEQAPMAFRRMPGEQLEAMEANRDPIHAIFGPKSPTKPFSGTHETILKQSRSTSVANRWRIDAWRLR